MDLRQTTRPLHFTQDAMERSCSGVNCVNVLTLSTSECDLIWRRLYRDDQVKIRLLGWALIQYDWYPWNKGKFRRRDRYTHEEMLQECDFRVWSDASTSKGTPKSVSKHQKLGERNLTDSQPSEGNKPAGSLISHLASRTLR